MSNSRTNLREACLSEAMRTIEKDGIEGLSLRKVARRLGVSHQAPYKHFASREHLLAEVVAEAFADFADFLDERTKTSQIGDELLAMGLAYIEFALAYPLKYRLMFSTTLPDRSEHPVMLKKAERSYLLLKDSLSRLEYARRPGIDDVMLERDAMLILTLVHGLVTALTSDAMDTLPISKAARESAIAHTLARIGTILGGSVPTEPEMERISEAVHDRIPTAADTLGLRD